MSFNLASILEHNAAAHPDKPMMHYRDQTVTFAQVDDRATRAADALLHRGLRPGDHVVLQLPNTPEFVYLYFGILKAGMTMVPINPMLAAPEIAYVLDDCRARLLVTHSSVKERALAAASQSPEVHTVVLGSPDATEQLFGAPSGCNISAATQPQDTAVVLYTSGTTGQPKGAELTHFQLYMNCTIFGDMMNIGGTDVMTAVLPLFHIFGLSTVLNVAVRVGVPVVLFDKFDPAVILESISQHRISVFAGVPTMYIALMHALQPETDVSTLRLGLSGGAALPDEVLRSVETTFADMLVLEGYGLSETASVVAFNLDKQQRKTGSIGRPIWGIEVRIVNESGTELPAGKSHVGEIIVRGHNVMRGYYNRAHDTAVAIRDGWFHTGDLGYRDHDGYLFVVDRLKDLIIRGGYNVYPREVEEVLYAHPSISEAAVIGAPDTRLGEEVVAFVTPTPGSSIDLDDLDTHCRARLAAYKYPRRFHILTALPRGATGKILKRNLHEESNPADHDSAGLEHNPISLP